MRINLTIILEDKSS